MKNSKADLAVKLRIERPTASLQEIGTILGITRERVRQLLQKQHVVTSSLPAKRAIKLSVQRRCVSCDSLIDRKNKLGKCRSCISKDVWTTVPCHYCGKEIPHYKFYLALQRTRGYKGYHWCNRKCQGFWLAKNYGFQAFPSHVRGGRPIKYSLEFAATVFYEHEAGRSYNQIAKRYSMNAGTIYSLCVRYQKEADKLKTS